MNSQLMAIVLNLSISASIFACKSTNSTSEEKDILGRTDYRNTSPARPVEPAQNQLFENNVIAVYTSSGFAGPKVSFAMSEAALVNGSVISYASKCSALVCSDADGKTKLTFSDNKRTAATLTFGEQSKSFTCAPKDMGAGYKGAIVCSEKRIQQIQCSVILKSGKVDLKDTIILKIAANGDIEPAGKYDEEEGRKFSISSTKKGHLAGLNAAFVDNPGIDQNEAITQRNGYRTYVITDTAGEATIGYDPKEIDSKSVKANGFYKYTGGPDKISHDLKCSPAPAK